MRTGRSPRPAGCRPKPWSVLTRGEAPDELDRDERAAQRLVLELTRDRRVEDETYAACECELGREAVVAVVFLAAAYMGTCTVLNAFDVPAPADGIRG